MVQKKNHLAAYELVENAHLMGCIALDIQKETSGTGAGAVCIAAQQKIHIRVYV